MDDITERLDNLRKRLQNRDFLEGKGLSNEVNIGVFCYEPKDKMIVRYFVDQFLNDKSLGTPLVVFDLYKMFLEICKDLDIVDAIIEMEAQEKSDDTLDQLHTAITSDDFIKKMSEKTASVEYQAIILTEVGDVFPFMRVHKLLEAMQPCFSCPIVVMYPGTYNGTELKLFNLLKASPYYRAFNIL